MWKKKNNGICTKNKIKYFQLTLIVQQISFLVHKQNLLCNLYELFWQIEFDDTVIFNSASIHPNHIRTSHFLLLVEHCQCTDKIILSKPVTSLFSVPMTNFVAEFH